MHTHIHITDCPPWKHRRRRSRQKKKPPTFGPGASACCWLQPRRWTSHPSKPPREAANPVVQGTSACGQGNRFPLLLLQSLLQYSPSEFLSCAATQLHFSSEGYGTERAVLKAYIFKTVRLVLKQLDGKLESLK
uniref:Uncharacterized protein n=1 Tax=Myotis myotis TaxID=51298 RepID=A0A7J7ZXU3_MYOMY|nr:hypothetical protein mMyoMyo1_009764 [Myotis myotis]